jgi:hypothetical protein
MDQLSTLFFSVVSLEVCMAYYNAFMDTHESMKKKITTTLTALNEIWLRTQPRHHYSEYLGKVSWVYEPALHMFYNVKEDITKEHKFKKLPWLSAEVYYGETKLDDCSVWVSELHYRDYGSASAGDGADRQSPQLTADVVLQAWATEKAHIIDYLNVDAYRIVVIDEEGNDKTYKMGDCAI